MTEDIVIKVALDGAPSPTTALEEFIERAIGAVCTSPTRSPSRGVRQGQVEDASQLAAVDFRFAENQVTIRFAGGSLRTRTDSTITISDDLLAFVLGPMSEGAYRPDFALVVSEIATRIDQYFGFWGSRSEVVIVQDDTVPDRAVDLAIAAAYPQLPKSVSVRSVNTLHQLLIGGPVSDVRALILVDGPDRAEDVIQVLSRLSVTGDGTELLGGRFAIFAFSSDRETIGAAYEFAGIQIAVYFDASIFEFGPDAAVLSRALAWLVQAPSRNQRTEATTEVPLSNEYVTRPSEGISSDAAHELLRQSEPLLGAARQLIQTTAVPQDARDKAESDLTAFIEAYNRPVEPLPSVLRAYLASIGAFVARFSGAIEALESAGDAVSVETARLFRTIVESADDPENSGAAIADHLARLNALRPEVDPAHANDNLVDQLALRRTAGGLAAVVGVGQLGTFVINAVGGVGLSTVTASVAGLVVSTIAAAAILFTQSRR